MTTIPQLSQHMKRLLTTTADHLARTTGFTRRRSPLTGARFAQILVFSWWANPAARCKDRAALARLLGCPVSAQAIEQRRTAQAAAFLRALLGAAVQTAVAADPVALPVLARFGRVVLTDGTLIGLPASLAATWPGCGNQHGTSAALKLLWRFDLCGGALDGPHLASGRTHDARVAATLPPLPPGTLHLGDLGFFHLAQFAAWSARGCYWLSRYKAGTTVWSMAGERLDLPRWLARHAQRVGTRLEVAMRLGEALRLPGRLLVERVPARVARERRADLAAEAAHEQRAVSPLAWALAAWTLLLTNCPAERLSVAEGMALEQARWQVELLIKRSKSLGEVDSWRTARPAGIECEIYAKLLVYVLQHWLLVVGCWANADRSLWGGLREVQQWGRVLARAWGRRRWLGELRAAVEAVGYWRLEKRRGDPATWQRLRDAAPPCGAPTAAVA